MTTAQRLTRMAIALTYGMIIAIMIRASKKTAPGQGVALTPFRCKTATENEIRARCVALGKSDEYARFMALCYRSGKTRKEIAGELNISEGTVKKYKHDRTLEMERPL